MKYGGVRYGDGRGTVGVRYGDENGLNSLEILNCKYFDFSRNRYRRVTV